MLSGRGNRTSAALIGLMMVLLLATMGIARLPGVSRPSASASAHPVPAGVAVLSSTPEATSSDVAGQLTAWCTVSPPVIDGQVDPVWATIEPLRMGLTWGIRGTERAFDLELRALRTDEAIHLLAQWPGEPPSGEENTVSNKLTVHWRIPELAGTAQGLDCTVACHTAFADGQGRFAYVNAETIPQGVSETLSAAGGWSAGTWTLEWQRPLVSANPYDLQFTDLGQAYRFYVKVFEGVEGRPDPVSEVHVLTFQP